MNRRDLLRLAAAAPALAFGRESNDPIYVTLTVGNLEERRLRYIRQIGVRHLRVVDTTIPGYDANGYLDADSLRRVVRRLDEFGIRLASIYLNTRRNAGPLLLGRPGWEAELDNVCRTIEAMGRAGVPMLNLNLLVSRAIVTNKLHQYSGYWLPGYYKDTEGRGRAQLQGFNEELANKVTEAPAGAIPADEMWDRITRFQKRVVPVAAQAKVKLACHPDDPPIAKHWGVTQVLNSREGLVRMVNIVPSEYNGVLLCLGTMYESGADVLELIRYFGGRKLLFDIDFRAVKGKVPHYREVFLDEGDLNMRQALVTLRSAGYRGSINPDHMPKIIDDPELQPASTAWAVGYIKGLLDSTATAR